MSIAATWRGEAARIVSIDAEKGKVQIARKGVGLRWVQADTVQVVEVSK